MPSTTYAEACGAAVAANGPMLQIDPWFQQPCVVAMMMSAEHFPGGAMLVPAQQLQCQHLQAAAQPQMQQGSMNFVYAQQDWKIQSQPFYSVDNASYREGYGMADDAADSTTQGSYSEADQSMESQDRELLPRRPKLTVSAARKLRRKRAADRSTVQLPAAEASHNPCKDLLSAGPCNGPPASCLDAGMLSELQVQLSQCGRKGVEDALAAIRGKVWSLSCDPKGCRLVQLALERASQQEASDLVVELHGHVQEAATSPHANYVLQKVISQLTFNAASFIAEELAGSCARLSKHRIGCRIFCRLLEFFGTESLTLQLVEELLALGETEELYCDSFSHHIMQKVLEHGIPQHRKQAVVALLNNSLAYAQHKHASYLIESALCYSCQENKQVLLAQLSHADAIASLALSRSGCHVVRALLKVEEADTKSILHTIRHIMPQLWETKHGQCLLIDLGLETDDSF